MGFWDSFKTAEVKNTDIFGSLYSKIEKDLPTSSEYEKVIIACVSGLMARVAYVDFDLDPNELLSMKEILVNLSKMDEKKADLIVNIATSEIKELAGLENHIYAHELQKIMSETERYEVLEMLFHIAASDGSVEEVESEEIRIITKGLGLTPKHYLSARATVWEKIKALNL